MSKNSLEYGLAALVGLGFGLIISGRKIDRLECERMELELHNKCLEADNEILQRHGDNLREANKLLTDLLMQEKGNEES